MKYLFCCLIALVIFNNTNAQQGIVETSHYIFPEFCEGIVLMKSGEKNEAPLNYNSLSEQMIFEKKGMKLAIGDNQLNKVDTVFIKDRKFIVMNNKFVEVIYCSSWAMFAEHKCNLEEQGTSVGYGGTSQTSAAKSTSALITDSRVVYELELPEQFKVSPYIIYWLNMDGELHSFANMKELKKLFDHNKEQLKKYTRENRVKFHDQESLIELVEKTTVA